MKECQNSKFNRLSKHYIEICQLIVMAVLFLFVFNNELVVFVKDFIGALPIGGGLVESIAIKGYFVFKVLASSPSLFVLTLVFLQLMIFAHAIRVWLVIYARPFVYDKEDIVLADSTVDLCKPRDNTYCCVDMRLLL